jgi:hypothetical protein
MGSRTTSPLLIKSLVAAITLILSIGAALGIGIFMSVNAFAADAEEVELTALPVETVQAIDPQKIELDVLEVPASSGLVDLLRTTLLMVNAGNQSGDYSVLYANLTPPVQKNLDVNRLSEALAGFREEKIDMSAVSVVNPQYIKSPEIDANGVLNLIGYFPTHPRMVRFSVGYRKLDGKWLVEAIDLDAPSKTEPVTQSAQAKPPAVNVAPENYVPPPTTTRW